MLIKNNKSNILHVNGKRLGPGTNTVEAEWWKKAKEHPSIAKRLELGSLEEVNAPDEDDFLDTSKKGKGKSKKASADAPAEDSAPVMSEAEKEADLNQLKSMKVNQAKDLVKSTMDVELLSGWMKREDRGGVKDAIKLQLKKLKEPLETRDRTKSRQVSTGREVETVEVKAEPSAQDD